MRVIKIFGFLFLLLVTLGCEKDDIANQTTDAEIIDFVTEKCYCCWGWVIDIGKSYNIKADSIPGLQLSDNTVFPIKARIKIGEKTRDCSTVGTFPDYYEIKEFQMIK